MLTSSEAIDKNIQVGRLIFVEMSVRHFNPDKRRKLLQQEKGCEIWRTFDNDNVFYASVPDKYQIKTFLIRLIGFLMYSLSVDIVITPMFAAIINVGLGVMDAID